MTTSYDTITCRDRYMDTNASADMRHEYTRTLAVPVTYPMGIRDAIERERVYVGRSLLPRAIRDSMAASGGVRLIIARP